MALPQDILSVVSYVADALSLWGAYVATKHAKEVRRIRNLQQHTAAVNRCKIAVAVFNQLPTSETRTEGPRALSLAIRHIQTIKSDPPMPATIARDLLEATNMINRSTTIVATNNTELLRDAKSKVEGAIIAADAFLEGLNQQ